MKLAVLTSSYPYYPGEQFIENEVEYWEKSAFTTVFVLPWLVTGSARQIPEKIQVDLCLSRMNKLERLYFLGITLCSSLFFKEIIYLCKSRNVCLDNLIQALKQASMTLQLAHKLSLFAKQNGGIDVVYSYWNDMYAYAAILVKKKGLVEKVVSRTHGIDLYEERRKYKYMPLKRQFIQDFDQIFALSTEAKEYLQTKYRANPAKLSISPLGVGIPVQTSCTSPDGNLHIVSVSFCRAEKRLDRVIEALAIVTDENKQLQIKWTHIGEGPLLHEIQSLSHRILAKSQNITIEFKGNLENVEVKNFYLAEPVDIFINTSESEGIPVSIMEAMSFGIPALAPDIGGVSELVSNEFGILMSDNPTVEEIASSILHLSRFAKDDAIRSKARQKIKDDFNADQNYNRFMQMLCSISNT